MMILIVGSKHYASYESSCARCFERRGCEVVRWDNKRLPGWLPWRSWWEMRRPIRDVYDLAASREFVRVAERAKPDVIFMPKGENLHHRAVREAKERTKARLVVWYPDNPYRAENTTMNILWNMLHVDIFYIWGKFLLEALRSAGCRRPEYLPFGFDPDLHGIYERSGSVQRKAGCVHVGSYSEEKRDALVPLAECGLRIYGPGWEQEKLRGGPLAQCVAGSGLYGAEMVKAYKEADVVANPIRLQNMPAHNLRTIEAAGIGGGVVLTQRTPEQARELFTEDEEILCYGSPEEMREKALWAAAHPEKCAEMARRARERVFREHLLQQRIDKILEDLDGA